MLKKNGLKIFTLVLLLIFAVCAYFAITDVIKDREALLHVKLYSKDSTAEDIMFVFSTLGDTLRVILVAALFLVIPKFNVKCGIPAAISVIIATVVNNIIKPIIARPRPEFHAPVITDAGGTSFPSGHSMCNMALYLAVAVAIWLFASKKGVKIVSLIIALALAFTIGFARLYFGAHYPSDIVAGWALGAICGLLVPVWYYKSVYPVIKRRFIDINKEINENEKQ